MNNYNNIRSIMDAMYTPLNIGQETDFQLLKNPLKENGKIKKRKNILHVF